MDRNGSYPFLIHISIVGGEFSEEGLSVVKQKDKWGYATLQGKIAISPQFESAQNFSGGLAAVKQQSKWGFIDEHGIIKIKPQFGGVK